VKKLKFQDGRRKFKKPGQSGQISKLPELHHNEVWDMTTGDEV
jgi:hypothetical protein